MHNRFQYLYIYLYNFELKFHPQLINILSSLQFAASCNNSITNKRSLPASYPHKHKQVHIIYTENYPSDGETDSAWNLINRSFCFRFSTASADDKIKFWTTTTTTTRTYLPTDYINCITGIVHENLTCFLCKLSPAVAFSVELFM